MTEPRVEVAPIRENRQLIKVSTQRMFAWSGVIFLILLVVGYWGIAGFVPPPSPNKSAADTAAAYEAHNFRIKLGLMITMLSAPLYGSWSVAISIQLKRMEGSYSPLAYFQMLLGALLVLEIIFPVMIWQAAAYRPSLDIAITQRLNDLGWLTFVGVVSTGALQIVIVAFAALTDKREVPIFPRWLGYFSLWMALIFLPGGFIVFFKSGVLAWTGLIGFWGVFISFAAWVSVVSYVLLRRSIRQMEAEEAAIS